MTLRESSAAAFLLMAMAAPLLASEPAHVVDGFHAALQRGDTKAVAALLAPDALIFEAGHVERSAAEYAGGHLAGDAAQAAKTRTTLGARRCMLGTDQAVIATETLSTALDGSDPRAGTETMVLKKFGADWRIGHIHWSSRKLASKQAPSAAASATGQC